MYLIIFDSGRILPSTHYSIILDISKLFSVFFYIILTNTLTILGATNVKETGYSFPISLPKN